ncbi:apurinic endonuclease (APN1) [Eubacterium sp. 14-2]|uniref:deoxyribonuclease IV n=1 Tax=Eubacterium sp. 14-2 TaxID=1235790 RepID=UPI00033AE659|nr:deoxyribonuclease IV [Eubacterium sp. 14-2]EOT25521.1 apurinic endonuclease (APN1) [Eubacterium sp. 14-2]
MLRIGCHLSSSRGFLAMGKEAVKIGANTFQFFTRNPRGGKARERNPEDIAAYLEFAKEHGIAQILAHAPYTLNACAKDEGLRQFAYDIMCDDLSRLEYFPEAMYNFHPGSHVKQGAERGVELIADMLNRINEKEYHAWILLETMAGKGTEMGRNFEELRAVIDRVEDSSRLGVCLDTCHVFDSGYDIVNHLEEVIKEFQRVIGLERLKAMHLNDSMYGLESHKDRHAKIGEGKIGLETFRAIVTHPALCSLPFFLETPNDLEGYGREIALLRKISDNS